MSPQLRKDLIEHWEKRYAECCAVLQRRIDAGKNVELVSEFVLREAIGARLRQIRYFFSGGMPFVDYSGGLPFIQVGYYC